LQSQVVECLLQFKDDRRADLCNNVLVAGGTMSMANTAPRLQREVQPLCEDEEITTPVSVRACKHGGVLDAWIGAAAMSQLSVWPELLITKAEFEEAGADVANRKCM
jgi:actin, other eukaryote